MELTLQNQFYRLFSTGSHSLVLTLSSVMAFPLKKRLYAYLCPFSHFVPAGILYLNVFPLMVKSASTSPSERMRDVGITISCSGSPGIVFSMFGESSFKRVEAFVPAHPPILPVFMFIIPLKQRAVPPALFPICMEWRRKQPSVPGVRRT